MPADFQGAVTDFPNVIGAELAHRGYTRHTVDATRWLAEYRIVDDVTDPSSVGADVAVVRRRPGHARRRDHGAVRADVTSPR